jgi:hypothetical protein
LLQAEPYLAHVRRDSALEHKLQNSYLKSLHSVNKFERFAVSLNSSFIIGGAELLPYFLQLSPWCVSSLPFSPLGSCRAFFP